MATPFAPIPPRELTDIRELARITQDSLIDHGTNSKTNDQVTYHEWLLREWLHSVDLTEWLGAQKDRERAAWVKAQLVSSQP
jgi:hypothetical protein